MKQLLSIEYSKLKKLNSLRTILIIYMLIVPLWMLFMGFFFKNAKLPFFPTQDELYSFPGVWRFVTYSASWFNMLMAITVVIITCNEIHFRTMKQNVIDGLTKQQVILSKFYVILLLALVVTIYTALLGLLIGGFYSGFSGAFKNIHYVPTYFLQTLGYFSFAFLFSVLIRKPALSIILFVVSFLLEWIVGIILNASVSDTPYQFFPLKSFSSLTPVPFFEKMIAMAEKQGGTSIWIMPAPLHYAIALVYIFLFFAIAYRVLKKRDL